jgi:hypothetical protein
MKLQEIDALDTYQLQCLVDITIYNAHTQALEQRLEADWRAFAPKWLRHAETLLNNRINP